MTAEDNKPSDLKALIETEIVLKRQDASSTPQEYTFMIICTHCLFDHIRGIESFARDGATICASGYDPGFNRRDNRAANPLCDAFGMPIPDYHITHYLDDNENLCFEEIDLKLQALHTPGRTPDSLAVYDQDERWLFVGDTCYKRVADMPWGERQDVPIVFPLQGNRVDFRATLEELQTLVAGEETGQGGRSVRIACGHTTSDAPAAELLRDASGSQREWRWATSQSLLGFLGTRSHLVDPSETSYSFCGRIPESQSSA